jgi:hypothetical protein
MKTSRLISKIVAAAVVTLFAGGPLLAEDLQIGGFVQGLYGGKLQQRKLTPSDYSASEMRLQLRLETSSGDADLFGRVDFVYDDVTDPEYQWELREGYIKYTLFRKVDFKIGRQILTWGTGDLVFINDLFAKDYESFFAGRDDQYLKAPQTAIRTEYYSPVGALSVVWTPRFTPNRTPTGERFSYYNPMMQDFAGGPPYAVASRPADRWENSEIAARFQRGVGSLTVELYAYRGFFKNPLGLNPGTVSAYYPKLSAYGASVRGQLLSGILWLEGGYYDSREDRCGAKPFVPNSSVMGLIGYERQIATDLTGNIQYQADFMEDYDHYELNLIGTEKRDELRSLLTWRLTRNLRMETVQLSSFVFWSPSDEDVYYRFSLLYKYNDALTLTVGGNLFDGQKMYTDFGSFAKNDNLYAKMTYGF